MSEQISCGALPAQLNLIKYLKKINSILHMDSLDLIPEVLDKEPLNILQVKFQGRLLKPGDVLRPKCVKLTPELEWRDDNTALYTIFMIDPDAPSRNDHRFREFLHWLVINAPLNKVKRGTTIAGYIGAGPPKGTGLHRYVILVFKQNEKITFEEARISRYSAFGRARFSNKAFARKYNLGPLVAGNIFLSEWDDYVPKLYKRLQFCPSH
ncbi:protein D2-like [Coccinella septempunctata]|uniref:protein D2-like n=1 Tax=Coccinella septempunctata TaxID=41139 RepID=UPI001D068819|nr:protein D2-like [Coccinella septempunctata]